MLNITFEKFCEFPEKTKKIEKYLIEKVNPDEESIYSIKLAVFELAGNIIKHSKTKARMLLTHKDDIIKILFKGSGPFELKQICLPSENCECGRGIFIIKNISESLEYYDEGRQVCVCIKCRKKTSE